MATKRIVLQPVDLDDFDILVALVSKAGVKEVIGNLHPVSLRMPTVEFCTVEAIAKHSGQSRNRIINQMISVSISWLQSELDTSDLNAIGSIRSAILQQFMQGDLPFESGSL